MGRCEADAHADRNYRRLFATEGEWFCDDARTIETGRMPDFDLLCAGFPCQAFSIAGKRRGFEDARGTLFFEIARVAKDKRPSYVLLENVPGLLSHDQGRTFHTILGTLSELGYHVEWKVLNSKDFRVPQSRKRVYIVGYLDGRCTGKILPFPETNGAALTQVIPGPQGNRVYHPDGLSCTLTARGRKTGLYEMDVPIKENTKEGCKLVYHGDSTGLGYAAMNTRWNCAVRDIVYTLPAYIRHGSFHIADQPQMQEQKGSRAILTPAKAETRQNGRRMKESEEPIFTLAATDRHGAVCHGRIRRLAPRECFRLQGYHDSQIDKMLAGMSDAQLYQQAGNGVTVTVIEAIGIRLRRIDEQMKTKNDGRENR